MKAVPRGPYNVIQVYAKSANGSTILDVDGNEYIECVGGIGIQNVGYCHPKVVETITKQASKLIHSCFHVAPYESYIALAERLNELAPGRFTKKTKQYLLIVGPRQLKENAIKIMD